MEFPIGKSTCRDCASTPARVRITSAAGGIWEAPFNGANWLVATQYGTGGTGDFWFEPWGSAGFHVKVFYDNGTTDEVDVANSSTPSTLAATFLGITGEDRVGQNGLPEQNGIPDWQIRLTGLRDTPIAVRITSPEGESGSSLQWGKLVGCSGVRCRWDWKSLV